MESPARAALMLAVTLSLSGCFESQTDETFEDTVVRDDVGVRVLHAVSDAPALRVKADAEVRVAKLDYGQVATFKLAANHYRFEAAGHTGGETPEPLLSNLEGNLTEGRRHDLLLTGSLGNDNARAIVLEQDDEPFEPEDEGNESDEADEPVKDVRFRTAHLAPGGGAVDLYLGDTSGSPDASLAYGESSEPIRVEAGVHRVQITPAGSSDVIYDSDAVFGWETGDDLLLAVAPATGVQRQGDSELSLIEVDGEQSQRVSDTGQGGELAFVNASTGTVTAEDRDDRVTWTDVEPVQKVPERGYDTSEGGQYALDFTSSGQRSDQPYGFRLSRGHAGTVVLRALGAAENGSVNASFLSNDARPVATNARVRVFNTWFQDPDSDGKADPVDIYLIEGSGCESPLSGDGVVPQPNLSSLAYSNRSSMLAVQAGDYQLVVTESDDPGKRLLCDDSVSLKTHGLYELVIARSQSGNDSGLIKVNSVR
ncbi:DUF4397 domain-containing protein [Salicola sp. Rm-C-2C1-2]|uniref:DUF4397 domain-containing protein n=1 Tax=Salicola sp. Rm-C-2C1-2 TaxID=3141321 RepID=UPI0032E50E5E